MKQHKTILITGGSRGIGRSTALELARRGMAVVVTSTTEDGGRAVVDEVRAAGGQAAALVLDVRRVERFAHFREQLTSSLQALGSGGLDGIVHNAGFGHYAGIADVDVATFDALYEVHLKGPFFLTQALLPVLSTGSQIVNVTSATTRVATIGVAPYAAFKSALESLTRAMAKEWGPRQIRANAVSPGAIRTELGGGLTPEFEQQLAAQTALGRVGEPDDVARVIAALLGDDLGWVNAQCIEVAGGYVI